MEENPAEMTEEELWEADYEKRRRKAAMGLMAPDFSKRKQAANNALKKLEKEREEHYKALGKNPDGTPISAEKQEPAEE